MDTQVAPFYLEALRASRPAPEITPLGYIFHATDTLETFVRAINPATNLPRWDLISNGAPGGLEFPYLVGPIGSGAPYQTFTAAIADASAAGAPTVYAFSGAYAESFTLPANLSIIGLADPHTIVITGNITLDGASGIQAIQNIDLIGTLIFTVGGASVFLTNVLATGAAGNPGMRVTAPNFNIFMVETQIIGTGAKGLDANASVSISAEDSSFQGDATHAPIAQAGGSQKFVDVNLTGMPTSFSAAVSADWTNVTVTLQGTTSSVVSGFAGSFLDLHGWVRFRNLDATGVILGGAGTLGVDPGVDIGSLQVANLPTGSINDGAVAFCSDLAGAVGPVYFGNGRWRRYSDNSPAN